MKHKPFQTPVKSLAGKSAIFVRGFGEYLRVQHDKGRTSAALRAAQDAGQLAVVSKGESISIPYISQLSGRLEAEGIYTKLRLGKSFTLNWTEESIAPLLALLDDDNFGNNASAAEVTVEDLKARTKIIDHLEDYSGVVIHHDAPVPKAVYKLLWDRFNKGELVMAFVNNDQDLHDDYPTFAGASVRTQNDDDE